jgi:hypothetical protein
MSGETFDNFPMADRPEEPAVQLESLYVLLNAYYDRLQRYRFLQDDERRALQSKIKEINYKILNHPDYIPPPESL